MLVWQVYVVGSVNSRSSLAAPFSGASLAGKVVFKVDTADASTRGCLREGMHPDADISISTRYGPYKT